MRDFFAADLATPPPGRMPPESGPDTFTPASNILDAARQQEHARREAARQRFDRLGTNETEAIEAHDRLDFPAIAVEHAGTQWTFRDTSLNFTYSPPDKTWLYREEAPTSDTRLILFSLPRRIMGAIDATELEPLTGLSPAQLVEVIKVGVAARGVRLEVKSLEDRTVDGVPGKLMVADTEVESQKLTHVYWIAAHAHRQYMLAFWTEREHREKLLSMTDSVIDGFRIIDKSQSPAAPVTEGLSYVSPGSGFSLQLSSSGWRRADEFLEIGVGGEVGAVHVSRTGLIISPIPLQGHTPSLQAAVRGMLTLYGAAVRPEQLRNLKTIKHSETPGIQFDFEQLRPSGVRRCRCQIFLKNDRAYVVCATAQRTMFDDAVVDDALTRFRLDPSAADVDLAAVPESLQTAHAGFFTGLGLHEFDRGNFGGAAGQSHVRRPEMRGGCPSSCSNSIRR